MRRPRRNHTAAFKAKVALAALKGDQAILAARYALYVKARDLNPGRWSGPARDWSPAGAVTLNPERDSVVKAHAADNETQRLAA